MKIQTLRKMAAKYGKKKYHFFKNCGKNITPKDGIFFYLVSHKEVVTTVTHTQRFLQEGKDPVACIHVTPLHVILKNKNKSQSN